MRDTEECRAFVVHLRAEHRRLRELLRDIEQSHRRNPKRVGDFVDRLRSLRDELQRHFAEEDSGGCMEEAVSHAPELSHVAIQLGNEHPELLAELDRIIEVAEIGKSTSRGGKAYQEFQRFAQKVHAHEAAENRLLAHGLGLEVDEVE